jgi:signal transduction histidine kinase
VLLSKTLHSSTLKLALTYVAVFSAAIFAVLGYVYWITAGHLSQQFEESLSSESASLLETYNRAGRDGLGELIEARVKDRHFDEWGYLLLDSSLNKIAGNMPTWPLEFAGTDGSGIFSLPLEPSKSRRAQFRGTYQTLPDGSRLLIARTVADLDRLGNAISIALLAAAALFLILAAAAALSTSRRSVARIEAINATSRQIMRSGLGERIPLRGTRDEWDELAANLNSMLERIQELAEWNRQVSDNVAHDLRTPLSRLRGRLEKASAQEPDLSGYRELINGTLGELDEILKTFSSLLRISQIETSNRTAGFVEVDLTEIAREVVDLFDPTAEQRAVRLQLLADDSVFITGDRDLLFDAISNLVDNAIKHGRERGEVTVTVLRSPDGPVLTVADRGPGISIEERKNVLRRFYRLERSRNSPGNGLGLSLVAAVVQLHDGHIAMTDNAPGLNVEVHFPTPQTRTPAGFNQASA